MRYSVTCNDGKGIPIASLVFIVLELHLVENSSFENAPIYALPSVSHLNMNYIQFFCSVKIMLYWMLFLSNTIFWKILTLSWSFFSLTAAVHILAFRQFYMFCSYKRWIWVASVNIMWNTHFPLYFGTLVSADYYVFQSYWIVLLLFLTFIHLYFHLCSGPRFKGGYWLGDHCKWSLSAL